MQTFRGKVIQHYQKSIPFWLKHISYIVVVVLAALALKTIIEPNTPAIQLFGGCEHAAHKQIKGSIRKTHCPDINGPYQIQSDYFKPINSGVQFSYFGNHRNVEVYIESKSGGKTRLYLQPKNKEAQYFNFLLPKQLLNTDIKFQLRDYHEEKWIAVGELTNNNFTRVAASGDLDLVYKLSLLHIIFALLLLVLKTRLENDKAILLLPIIIGIFGYFSFFTYVYSHLLGLVVSAVFLVSICYGAWLSLQPKQYDLLINTNATVITVTAFVLFIITIGLYPYTNESAGIFTTSSMRWRDLPVDNWIPKVFADQVWNMNIQSPMLPGWLSSDRPPLQSGINLLLFPVSNSGETYQLLSMYLQALVFLPILLLLRQLNLTNVTTTIFTGLAASSLFALHTIFVWPKLISACYLLITYLLLIPQKNNLLNLRQPTKTSLAGISSCLAMLCHGGALFGLIPIYLLSFIRHIRSRSAPMTTVGSGFLLILIYIPWLYYQKITDPPGDRLTKWHIAGMPNINDLSLMEAIHTSYEKLSFNQWLANKIANFDMITAHPFAIRHWLVQAFNGTQTESSIDYFWNLSFGHFFFSFWLMSPFFATCVYLIARFLKKNNNKELYWLTATSILGLLVWIIIIFLPGSTSIHQGTFFLWVTFFIVSCYMLNYAHQYLLQFAVLLNLLIFVQYYILDLHYKDVTYSLLYISLSALTFFSMVISFKLTSEAQKKPQ